MDEFNDNFDDFDIGPQSDEFIPDSYEDDLQELSDQEAWEDSHDYEYEYILDSHDNWPSDTIEEGDEDHGW